MKFNFTFLSCLIIFSTKIVTAQQTKKDIGSDSSYWQIGLTFQNDNVYLGRKDSTRLPYLTPSIGYYDKSGLFIDASLSYLNATGNNRIDLFTIEGGYNYTKDNFEARVVGDKFFYNSNSTSVKSEVKGSLDAYAAYDFDFIKPSFEVTGNFGKKSDIVLTFGLEHTFYTAEDKLDITPSAFVNAGTRNYYSTYSNKRSLAGLRKKKNANGQSTYTITAQVKDASQLKFLDYELSLPINYTYNRFTFNLTPSYAMPVNPARLLVSIKTPSTPENSITSIEKLSNIFYYTFGLTYNL